MRTEWHTTKSLLNVAIRRGCMCQMGANIQGVLFAAQFGHRLLSWALPDTLINSTSIERHPRLAGEGNQAVEL
jgi:hypothetical protein